MNFKFVDLARIEPTSLQCECSALPLSYRPKRVLFNLILILIFNKQKPLLKNILSLQLIKSCQTIKSFLV